MLYVLLTPLFIKVLHLYGVDSLWIDGGMSYEKRNKVVTNFHTLGNPRVFIFLSVGSTGLNLSIADVIIFFVSELVILPIYSYSCHICRINLGVHRMSDGSGDAATVSTENDGQSNSSASR